MPKYAPLFNITGIPLKRATRAYPPPPPPAAAEPAGAAVPPSTARPTSARYSAFKALKARRRAATAPEPEPEPELEPEAAESLVSEAAALALAHSAAAENTGGSSAGRRVGCCIFDSTDSAGNVLVVSSNAWDLPLAPNTGICAERRALAALMLHGKLDASAAWTMAVSHSPCVHCAATILLFPEVKRVVYSKGASHRDAGVEMLRAGGCAVDQLPDPPGVPPASDAEAVPKRPRPLPEATALRRCELRNRGGSLLYRGTPNDCPASAGTGCGARWPHLISPGRHLTCWAKLCAAFCVLVFRGAMEARTVLIAAARAAAAYVSTRASSFARLQSPPQCSSCRFSQRPVG